MKVDDKIEIEFTHWDGSPLANIEASFKNIIQGRESSDYYHYSEESYANPEKTKIVSVQDKIIKALTEIIEKMGAKSDILGILNSYEDTMTAQQVLEELEGASE